MTIAAGQVNTNVPFCANITLPAGSTPSGYITATATLAPTATTGGTSVFSNPTPEYNGLIVTNTNDNGPGSLRDAIDLANIHPGLDTITFNLPGPNYEIDLNGGLSVYDPTVIDGTDNGHRVILSGKNFNAATTPADLLTLTSGTYQSTYCGPVAGLTSSGSTIENLAFVADAYGAGVRITTDTNTIVGNDFGTPDLTKVEPLLTGVVIDGTAQTGGTASKNQIGGGSLTDATQYNVIVGATDDGIEIVTDAADPTHATGNSVSGNYLGALPTGTATTYGNGNGVAIAYATGNTIGGSVGNVISGNQYGVDVDDATALNTIQNNLIGLAPDGATALPNLLDGVELLDSNAQSVTQNTISDNKGDGVDIDGGSSNVLTTNVIDSNAYGLVIDTSTNNTIGGTTAAAANTISLNVGDGVNITNATGANAIEGNNIGFAADGKTPAGNLGNGVVLGGSPGQSIASNLIGYNVYGVYSSNSGGSQITGNTITKNTGDGIDLNDGNNSVSAGNIITLNGGDGVFLNGAAATKNLITANYIGTDTTGTANLGNQGDGVDLNAAPAISSRPTSSPATPPMVWKSTAAGWKSSAAT